MDHFKNSGTDESESLVRGESAAEVLGSDGAEPTVEASSQCEEFGEILHGLNNVLVSILLNAQLIEWKLPSYSGMRRNVHEVERSAQRGALLVNRLKHWLDTGPSRDPQTAHAGRESVGVQR